MHHEDPLPLHNQATSRWLRSLLDPSSAIHAESNKHNSGDDEKGKGDRSAGSSFMEHSVADLGTDEEQFQGLVTRIDSWNEFDIFSFNDLSSSEFDYQRLHLCLHLHLISIVFVDRPCLCVGMLLFDKFDLIKKFRIDKRKLVTLLNKIDDGYREIAYHNRIHGSITIALLLLALTS